MDGSREIMYIPCDEDCQPAMVDGKKEARTMLNGLRMRLLSHRMTERCGHVWREDGREW